jgi:hypothetical protein
MAQHRQTRQKQIQTSASALTYDVVRFLKVPLKYLRHIAIQATTMTIEAVTDAEIFLAYLDYVLGPDRC